MPSILYGLFRLGEYIKQYAKEKKRYFATLPDPERFMFVTVGGKLEKIVENVSDWELDEDTHWFKKVKKNKKKVGFLETTLGVTWIGLYGEIKVFKDWSWTEFRLKEDKDGKPLTEYEITPRKKDVEQWLQQFTLSVPLKNMELAGDDQADADALVTILILDSERAYFRNKNWQDTLVGIIQSAITGWVGPRSFDQVKADSASVQQNSDFAKDLIKINGLELNPDGDPDYSKEAVPGSLFQVLGIVIWTVALQNLEAKGPAADARRAKVVNELQGAADIVAAENRAKVRKRDSEAERDAKIAIAEGERAALEQTAGYMAWLPGGPGMYEANQVANSDLIYWGGSGKDGSNSKLPPIVLPVAERAPKVPDKK